MRAAGIAVADLATGLFATQAVLLALQARHTTGLGQQVEVSLLESLIVNETQDTIELSNGVLIVTFGGGRGIGESRFVLGGGAVMAFIAGGIETRAPRASGSSCSKAPASATAD